MSENLRGMILMTASMAAFALGDAFIKVLGETHPSGQIIFVAGLAGAAIFALMAIMQGDRPVTRDILAPGTVARIVAEAVATFGIVIALTRIPLSVTVAIMQSIPLLVTLGAALFLRETVGWRRWAAIAVGLFGVLVILRPTSAGFTPDMLYAIVGVIGLSIRDLCTRVVPPSATNFQLGAWGFAGLIPTGLLLMLTDGMPNGAYTPEAMGLLAAISIATIAAILAVTMAMRLGDVSAISPFRYTRLLFGLALAILWFGERPDAATWIGAAVVAGAGLYSLLRERQRHTI